MGIAYHPKTFALMDYLGQSRYCVDVDAFDARGLAGATEALESEREAAVARAAERIPHLRAQLHEHFDALVEPSSAPTGKVRIPLRPRATIG